MRRSTKMLAGIGAAVLALAAPQAVGQEKEGPVARAKRNCIEQWPADYSIQLHCYERQLDALRWIQEFNAKYPEGTPEGEVLVRCTVLWMIRAPKRDAAMVKHCTIREVAAMRTMQMKMQ